MGSMYSYKTCREKNKVHNNLSGERGEPTSLCPVPFPVSTQLGFEAVDFHETLSVCLDMADAKKKSTRKTGYYVRKSQVGIDKDVASR